MRGNNGRAAVEGLFSLERMTGDLGSVPDEKPGVFVKAGLHGGFRF